MMERLLNEKKNVNIICNVIWTIKNMYRKKAGYIWTWEFEFLHPDSHIQTNRFFFPYTELHFMRKK